MRRDLERNRLVGGYGQDFWREKMRTPTGLWDNEVDGDRLKPSKKSLAGRRRALWLAVGLWLVAFLVFAVTWGGDLAEEIRFQNNLSAVSQRARSLGGGVSNGRRRFRYHVGAWFHGKEITDRAMPEIVSIIRDCQTRGLGGPHLSLELDGTSVGNEGVALLRGVRGLKVIGLRDTRVTREGVYALRTSLPKTLIDAWPIHPLDLPGARGGPTP
jgi:hypothetical protein